MALQPMLGERLAQQLQAGVPSSVEGCTEDVVWVKPALLKEVASFLRDDPELDFQFLNSISAVDFIDHFNVVYHLTSFRLKHSAVVKTKLAGRDELSLPSVYEVWRGADFQEREIWNLMGIRFEGHPNMKRIMLWEGFQGHPLRKDYL